MKRFVFLSVLFVFATASFGQDSPTIASPSVPQTNFFDDVLGLRSASATIDFRSEDIFRNGLDIYKNPVVQEDLSLRTNAGITLDIWSSIPANFQDIGGNSASEFYPSIGWEGSVRGLNISASIGYDVLNPGPVLNGDDLIVITGEISHDFKIGPALTLSPYFAAELDFDPTGGASSDIFCRLGSRYSWEISDIVSLVGRVQILVDSGNSEGYHTDQLHRQSRCQSSMETWKLCRSGIALR